MSVVKVSIRRQAPKVCLFGTLAVCDSLEFPVHGSSLTPFFSNDNPFFKDVFLALY